MRGTWKLNKWMFLDWRGYLLGIALVALVTILKYYIPISSERLIFYSLAIAPVALFFGIGPAVFTAIISALVHNFFFVPPLYTFGLSIPGAQSLVILLIIGVIISLLSWTLKQHSVFSSAVADNAPNPIVVTNPDTSIKYVNPALERLTGFTSKELIGRKSPYPWWPPENHSQFEAENVSGRKKQNNRYERCYRKKNGEQFWVEVNISTVKDKSGIEYYLANWVDITERKMAEMRLIQSEEKLRRVFASISDGIVITDLDGNILDGNDNILKMLKASSINEIIGKNTLDFVNPDNHSRLLQQRQEALQGDPVLDVQYNVKRLDGTTFLAEVTSTIAIDKAGAPLFRVISCRDITERQRAEEAIRKSELQLEKLFEVMAEGVILWDTNLRGVRWNAEAERIFRMRREDTEGQPFNWSDWTVPPQWQLIDSDGALIPEEGRASFLALKEKRAVKDQEAGLKWPDGSITWIIANAVPLFDAHGNIEGVLGTFRDATIRRQILDRVRQSELQFQKLFDSLSEGVSLVNPDGRVIKSNPADSQILGLSADETRNHQFRIPHLKHIYPDGREMLLEETATYRAFKTRCPTTNPEVGIIRMDGSVLWISVNVVPLLDEKGEVTGAVRVITDITEQKRLREEREQFTRKLLEVQEEERKRIARELHDDAAQNLALIVLELDHLLSGGHDLSAKVIKNLQHLRDDADRTQQEVRRYSHELRPGVLDYLGLEAALEGLVEDVNARGPMRASLEIEGQGERLPDETELALFRIAQESINNVWKHSEATRATISLRYELDKVILTIEDNGKGFQVDEKPAVEGVGGLGLIGMKERAQLIGANLKIKSNPGKGTTISAAVSISTNN